MKSTTTLSPLSDKRLELLDFIRGIAIGLMFIFHISFGLSEAGFLNINFSQDYFWVSFRAIIVFLFLTLVGIGIVFSNAKIGNSTFLKSITSKRLLLLFVYMMLITLFSYYVRPQTFVYFGILHLIFVSSILGRLLINVTPKYLGLIALFILVVGLNLETNSLNHPFIYWFGLGNTAPISDDFAPLFPWFSLVVFGLILGKQLVNPNKSNLNIEYWSATNWLTKLICWAGKYSIHLYFIHFQLFYLMVWIINP